MNSNHYVNNKKFTVALGDWSDMRRLAKAADKSLPKMPEYVGECILKICTNLGYRPNFINYPYKDEMVGLAVETCVKYADRFNREKTTNAFGYISQIAYFSFIRKITLEKRRYKRNLQYMFNELDIDQLAGQLGDDKEYYQSYLDDMRRLLDDMEIDLDDEKPKKVKKSKPKENQPDLTSYMVDK